MLCQVLPDLVLVKLPLRMSPARVSTVIVERQPRKAPSCFARRKPADTHLSVLSCQDLPPGWRSVGHREGSPSDRGHCSLESLALFGILLACGVLPLRARIACGLLSCGLLSCSRLRCAQPSLLVGGSAVGLLLTRSDGDSRESPNGDIRVRVWEIRDGG